MSPLIVAVIADYWPPAERGGAVRALKAMIGTLASDVSFHVITRDHDALTGQSLPVVGANNWVNEGGIQTLRLSHSQIGLAHIATAIAKVRPHTIYANSLFSRLTQRLLIARRLGRLPPAKLVLAPEGELDPGALAIKPIRKRIWLNLAKASELLDGIAWKAASDIEVKAISSVLPSAEVHLVPHPLSFGTSDGPIEHAPKSAGRLRLLFLSRIAPKKNLPFLLQLLSSIAGEIELTIVGPVDDPVEWRKCSKIIAALPPNIRIQYAGSCASQEVWQFYSNADAFVLPTFGENYGYVIEDSLLAGCPPVISDRTPWGFLNLSEAGFILPLSDRMPWLDALNRLMAMDEIEHRALRDRCKEAMLVATQAVPSYDLLLRLLGMTNLPDPYAAC